MSKGLWVLLRPSGEIYLALDEQDWIDTAILEYSRRSDRDHKVLNDKVQGILDESVKFALDPDVSKPFLKWEKGWSEPKIPHRYALLECFFVLLKWEKEVRNTGEHADYNRVITRLVGSEKGIPRQKTNLTRLLRDFWKKYRALQAEAEK